MDILIIIKSTSTQYLGVIESLSFIELQKWNENIAAQMLPFCGAEASVASAGIAKFHFVKN